MGLTLGSLVRALFYCVLTIMLVVLVAWVLEFLYQPELIPNVIFFCFFVFVPIGVKSKGGRLIKIICRSNYLFYLQICNLFL